MDDRQSLRRAARRKMMLEDPVAKVIPALAVPMIVAMLIDSVYNMTDTYFVSQLGTSATAAVGVNDSLMQLIRSLAIGFGIGASSYISRLLGAKDYEKAGRVGSTALFTALLVIAAMAAVAYVFINPTGCNAWRHADGQAVFRAVWALYSFILAVYGGNRGIEPVAALGGKHAVFDDRHGVRMPD